MYKSKLKPISKPVYKGDVFHGPHTCLIDLPKGYLSLLLYRSLGTAYGYKIEIQ